MSSPYLTYLTYFENLKHILATEMTNLHQQIRMYAAPSSYFCVFFHIFLIPIYHFSLFDSFCSHISFGGKYFFNFSQFWGIYLFQRSCFLFFLWWDIYLWFFFWFIFHVISVIINSWSLQISQNNLIKIDSIYLKIK